MKYRAEIDGLRAVAVIPVILFHAGFDLFSGGFVGVDVFFVISGYLITTILIDEIESNRFSIVNFYVRRARRILPALFFVIFVCIPFAWMWMLPNQFKDFSKSIVAVSLFTSNILFWLESDYFADSAEEKPLLHTWSLAVEEQFYIFFPIFLLFAWRFGKNRLFWMIVMGAAISLALSEWGWRNKSTANFYLIPTRAWELFGGSIAAFIVRKRGVQSNNPLSLIGLAAIIFSIFFYNEFTPFPSLYTLVPVVGSVMLVLFADKETLAVKLLSTRGFVGIGLISYSAYLWHQPLFAFARIRLVEPPSMFLMSALSLAALILAVFSWRFVENPFRNKVVFNKKIILSLSLLFSIILISMGVVGARTTIFEEIYRGKLTDSQIALLEITERRPGDNWRRDICYLTSEANFFNDFQVDHCLALSVKYPNVLLIGDSHAAQWYVGLTENFPEVNIVQATASGCRPLLGAKGEKRCTDLNDFIFNDFLVNSQLDAIIIAGRWGEIEAKKYLPRTLRHVKMHVDNVYVFGPTIEYEESLPKILMRAHDLKGTDEDIGLYANMFLRSEKFSLSRILERTVEFENVSYISIVNVVCPYMACRVTTSDGIAMAFDYGHLTIEASVELVADMKANYSLLNNLEQGKVGSGAQR